jgi:hypothetical protein
MSMTATLPADVRELIDAHLDLRRRADEAFGRYFDNRRRGEPTNGAAWQRLENQANEAWIAVHNALCDVAKTNEDVWLGRDVEDYL